MAPNRTGGCGKVGRFATSKKRVIFFGEGRKPGALMNPRVIPTCIAFWPGEKELNLHRKHTTLEPNYNQLFLNLGRVSHDDDSINSYCRKCNQRSAQFLSTRKL